MVSVMAVSGLQVASAFNPLCQTPIIANMEIMSTVTKKSDLVDTFFFFFQVFVIIYANVHQKLLHAEI